MLLLGLYVSAGCIHDKNEPFTELFAQDRYDDYVPPSAPVVAEGTGALRFTPTTLGTLYLLDLDNLRKVKQMTTPEVVLFGCALPGPEITFDPATRTFTRPGKTPLKVTKVVPGHRYQLRWDPQEPK